MADCAAAVARAIRVKPLVIGLRGELGSGKTTWVRAMLRGLGHGGRVPSPTYTLLEQYRLPQLTVVHLDLYRLNGDAELENLGLRDSLADADTWTLVEWPERAPGLLGQCDVVLEFSEANPGRSISVAGRTPAGNEALTAFRGFCSSKGA